MARKHRYLRAVVARVERLWRVQEKSEKFWRFPLIGDFINLI